jgi:hypothetical protein
LKSAVLEHERSCEIISHEAFAKLNESKKFACDECVRSYDTKYLLGKWNTKQISTTGKQGLARRTDVIRTSCFR